MNISTNNYNINDYIYIYIYTHISLKGTFSSVAANKFGMKTLWSSGLLWYVAFWLYANVLEEHDCSTFRAENIGM
jgi:hypothetical protein